MAVESYTPAQSQREPEGKPIPRALLAALQEALRFIRFGSIELVIHDGRVVQIERREKLRLEYDGSQDRR
jgi:hypothetical protein